MVDRFEDLRVWRAARKQCQQVADLTKRPGFCRDFKLSAQISDASVSVMNNISEGFLRRHDKEFFSFLRYAAASNGEVRGCFYAALDRRYITDDEAAELIEASNYIGRMIRRLQDSLGRD
jgi:four helix bundle protein